MYNVTGGYHDGFDVFACALYNCITGVGGTFLCTVDTTEQSYECCYAIFAICFSLICAKICQLLLVPKIQGCTSLRRGLSRPLNAFLSCSGEYGEHRLLFPNTLSFTLQLSYTIQNVVKIIVADGRKAYSLL